MHQYTDVSIEDLFSTKSLQNIIENISSLIHHDMVITNREGVICAATRKDRIGIVNTKVREMIEANGDHHVVDTNLNNTEFRPGINLPIRYEGTPVGSVGITGVPEEVKVLASVVQALVQQQLKDLVYHINIAEKNRVLSNFVYSWIFKGNYQDKAEFETRSRHLNINVHLPRVISIIDLSSFEGYGTDTFLDQLSDRVQQYVEERLRQLNRQHIATIISSRIVALLNVNSTEAAKTIAENLQADIQQRFGLKCAIGISSPFLQLSDIRNSYEASKLACEASRNSKDRTIFCFDLFELELVVSTIERNYKSQVFEHFFSQYKSEEQIEETLELIMCYIQNNRSISAVSEQMNLHKNTVQCRLNKIHELTGYNPRDAKDLAYMYIVALMHKTGVNRASFPQ